MRPVPWVPGTVIKFFSFFLLWAPSVWAELPRYTGLHYTPEEVAVWRDRTEHGPYMDDWERIRSRADGFLSDPDRELWEGNQTNQVWEVQVHTNHPGRRRGDGLRDAGFVYLLTGETAYRQAVRDALLRQAARAGTDFSDRSKWDPSMRQLADNNFEIANWLRKLAYGYSYIRPTVSDNDQAVIDGWLRNAGLFWAKRVHSSVSYYFPNRLQDEYREPNPGSSKGKTHWGGYTFYSMHHTLNNIPAQHIAMVAAIGVLLDDAELKSHAKRFFKEWLTYAVASNGTVADQYRWNDDGDPVRGYLYAGAVIGSMSTIADHFARSGDVSLYDMEATGGYFGWQGGAKTLRRVVNRFANMTIAERGLGMGEKAYASHDGTLSDNELIGPGIQKNSDLNLIPANIFYRFFRVSSG